MLKSHLLALLLLIFPHLTVCAESLVYKKVGERELHLTIDKPQDWKSADSRPAIVFFHGGGWTGGKPTQFDSHAAHFAKRGMVCIQVEYRLITKGEKKVPQKCIEDARSAMRYVRGHAKELGIDPQRIAAGGGSAGGHLAACVGMMDGHDAASDNLSISPKAQALLLFNPVCDLGPDNGWGKSVAIENYKDFSPAHHISKDDPPAIYFLGSKDNLIPVPVAERFQSELKAVGVKCELHIYEGRAHGFFNASKGSNEDYLDTLKKSDTFLTNLGWLKPEVSIR